ncbi:MAG: restriction endonuclease subunit S [Clostridia bacterium]
MVSLPWISLPVTEDFQIHLPPIEVQREIVRILDYFTELTARKKQYKYYRDKLLIFKEVGKA